MGLSIITKADYNEYLRLKNLRHITPQDAASIGNLYRRAINPNYNYCSTCSSAINESMRRINDWFESNHDAIIKQITEPEVGIKEYKEWYNFIQSELKIVYFSRTNWKEWKDITDEQMKVIDDIIEHISPTTEKNLKLSAILKPIEKKLQELIIEGGETIE